MRTRLDKSEEPRVAPGLSCFRLPSEGAPSFGQLYCVCSVYGPMLLPAVEVTVIT